MTSLIVQQPPNEEHPFLLPEFELVIEAEDSKSASPPAETEEAAEKRRRTEAARLEAEQSGELASLPEADFMQFASATNDPVFSKFQKRVQRNKDQVTHARIYRPTMLELIAMFSFTSLDQVLRYDRGGDPLWVSDRYTLKADKVPNCDLCNSRRIFEFQVNDCQSMTSRKYFTNVGPFTQIMPQMLNSIKEAAFDWGIINIYTCENNCNIGTGYVKEYCFKQDIH